MRPSQEILFEFRRIGHVVKVSAIDAESGTEVAIVSPAGALRSDLERLAVQKLNYVLCRNRR